MSPDRTALLVVAAAIAALAAGALLVGTLMSMPEPHTGRVISVESDGTTHD